LTTAADPGATPRSKPAARALAALEAVTGGLAGVEDRPGQQQMAAAVAEAIANEQHLVVQAGTGTGKSLGYLVPAVLSGKKVVVATATKALQDQLASKDLPFLQAQLAAFNQHDLTWAVLKGRSNYACLQRIAEMGDGADQLELDTTSRQVKAEVQRLASWADRSKTGDASELDWVPSDQAWKAVSVGSDECPGAQRCPNGPPCFAERARKRAAEADVIVVNMHLYGLHVGSSGALLPPHDIVVFDEAHMLEDIVSDTVGVEIGPNRLTFVASSLKRVLADSVAATTLTDSSLLLREALRPLLGQRLPPALDPKITDALRRARQAVMDGLGELRKVKSEVADVKQRVLRATQLATRLAEEIDSALHGGEDRVPFVGGGPEHPRLEIAPLDVGPVLEEGVWREHASVLTSATIPTSLPQRVGLIGANGKPAGRPLDVVDVGSPFDYEANALLYCPVHLPDPRSADFTRLAQEELLALLTAAGGRTLALFTSWKAMDAAAETVRAATELPILTQRDMPKPALLEKFAADEATSLFATAGLFQGVDIPGRSLSLVVIDRIPFPRPDDPLLSARRELLGPAAFRQIDLPRASTLLAQATGRLIRTATDRGVVAVLDPRLGKAAYRWEIVNALPPMRRTRHRADAVAFLEEITR
jgi:ATP-dependent DNA helicase DinG